jgi:AraC-like DNA-binding protein
MTDPALRSAFVRLAQSDGATPTFLNNVTLYRAGAPVPKNPLVYNACLCLVVQGRKTAHLSDRSFTYDTGHYLVVPAVVPFECETVATPEEPFLSVTVGIDYLVVREILDTLGSGADADADGTGRHAGAFLDTMTEPMQNAMLRLLQSLESREEALILGRQAVREIYYRVLAGRQGHILASAARGESAYARVVSALRVMHDSYSTQLDVTALAETANMSVRSFHDHFKAATSLSPVQYLKRIRLEKARQLLVAQGLQAGVAAHMVGYESSSQFSREFKRHFGYAPSEAAEVRV